MRIAFGDFSGWDFHPQSVDVLPLGGSQSAACYLARELALQGHETFFVTQTSAPGEYAGVTCLSWQTTPLDQLAAHEFDLFVCVLGAGNGVVLRDALGPKARLVLWTQHRCDQPAVQPLAQTAERECYDAFVFVSEWQRAEFLARFGIATERTTVLRNAVTPSFLDLFPDGVPILSSKDQPPVLAYTSTPFRGLDLLLEAFPAIRSNVPGSRLRVFSSMKVYQMPAAADELQHGRLYERCRQTPGVEYVGSLPQPALAEEMRAVTTLAYPNNFPETSCIAVLEALAAGCRIVTSELGALPETSAGFAQLVPVTQSRESYLRQFIERVSATLLDSLAGGAELEERLALQVDYVRTHATWGIRAAEWLDWLVPLCQTPRPNRS